MSETEGCELFLQHVQLEVTGVCNMRCPHCRAWNEPRVGLSMDTIKNILDFIASESDGEFGVTISGGEPFVRSDLGRIVGLISSYPASQITVTTNGSLSTEDRLREIVANKGKVETVIQLSIDSSNAAQHDTFRGYNGAFDRAIKTIEVAQQIGLIATVRSTICSGRISSMRALVELARSLQVSIGFGTVVPFGRAIDNSLGMRSSEKKEFLLEVPTSVS